LAVGCVDGELVGEQVTPQHVRGHSANTTALFSPQQSLL
jgi:hypothetical protein